MNDPLNAGRNTKRGSIYVLLFITLVGAAVMSLAAALEGTKTGPNEPERALVLGALAVIAAIGYISIAAGAGDRSWAAGADCAALPHAQSDSVILGLRAWRAVNCGRDTIVLQSWHAQHALWPYGRELCADAASPGIHAFKSAPSLLRYVGPEIGSAHVVIGIVALWGTVIEHEGGWTAEKAYPLQICAPDRDIAARVRQLYGCETAWVPTDLTSEITRLEAKIAQAAPEA